MNNLIFTQQVTVIGEPVEILKLLNLPLPKKISDFGVYNTVWTMTHLHFKASMRSVPPIHLHRMSQQYPNIILAVTSGTSNGPTYRFLLKNGLHIPIAMEYISGKLQSHYEWAENLKLPQLKTLVKRKTPVFFEKIHVLDRPIIDITDEVVEVVESQDADKTPVIDQEYEGWFQ